MVKVSIINAVYPPEPVASAQIGRDLAQHLVHLGAQVSVLCPYPSRPLGVDYPDLRPSAVCRLYREEGVSVVRLPSFTAPQSRLLARMWESLSFGWHACRSLRSRRGDVDVVYANTWPLCSQALIAWNCARWGIPLVLHIQDIYPESLLVKLPLYAQRILATPLTALDRWSTRKADGVVVISENMRETYRATRGIVPRKVFTIPNWTDESRFERLPKRADICARFGIPAERFIFLYLGNIGPLAGVELLIEAFHAAEIEQAQMVIAGDGSSKAKCLELVERLGTQEIRFISCPDVHSVAAIQSMADVFLLPIRKGGGMSSIPSKLPSYLFSSRPVLSTLDADCDTARCIREANCGWIGEPENVAWLSAKMTEVAMTPAPVLDAMGQRGRAYGLKHFSKAEGVKRLAAVVLAAGASKAAPRTRPKN